MRGRKQALIGARQRLADKLQVRLLPSANRKASASCRPPEVSLQQLLPLFLLPVLMQVQSLAIVPRGYAPGIAS